MYNHTITTRTSTISGQGDCLDSISLFPEQIRAGATIRLGNAGAIIKLGKIFQSLIRLRMHVTEAIALVCVCVRARTAKHAYCVSIVQPANV